MTPIDVTWDRLLHLTLILESAVRDVRRGIEERKGYRVATGLLSVCSAMPEALRLLGRVDQHDEDRASDAERGTR